MESVRRNWSSAVVDIRLMYANEESAGSESEGSNAFTKNYLAIRKHGNLLLGDLLGKSCESVVTLRMLMRKERAGILSVHPRYARYGYTR